MKDSKTKLMQVSFVALVLIIALFIVTSRANASFIYDIKFGALTTPGFGTYAADVFSFSSPALIGPGSRQIPGSTFIESLRLDRPIFLNGFSFDTIKSGGVGFDGTSPNPGVSNIIYMGFMSDINFSVPLGGIGGFEIGIFFSPGGYGPGIYTSDRFDRGLLIDTDTRIVYYFNTTGTLTIREVTPVPEPTTMLLLGSGLIGLAGYGRKKFFKK